MLQHHQTGVTCWQTVTGQLNQHSVFGFLFDNLMMVVVLAILDLSLSIVTVNRALCLSGDWMTDESSRTNCKGLD